MSQGKWPLETERRPQFSVCKTMGALVLPPKQIEFCQLPMSRKWNLPENFHKGGDLPTS